MQMNRNVLPLVAFTSKGSLLTDHCSGVFLNEVRRAALLAFVFGISVLLATGCASTGKGLSARLISPVTTNQQAADAEDDIYQLEPSPRLAIPRQLTDLGARINHVA